MIAEHDKIYLDEIMELTTEEQQRNMTGLLRDYCVILEIKH